MRHIDGMRRLADARRGEPAALLGLRRGMIELEEEQVRRRLEAIGESVEPGAEDDDLPHAGGDGGFRRVLGEAAAHGDEDPQRPLLRRRRGPRDRLLGFVAEDAKRHRIGEHETALEPLVRRPMPRRADRRPARLTVLHCVAKVKDAFSVCRERALAGPAKGAVRNRGRLRFFSSLPFSATL